DVGIESGFVAFFDNIEKPKIVSSSFLYNDNNETKDNDSFDTDDYNEEDEKNNKEYEQNSERMSCEYDEDMKFAIPF
ncbi:10945_t:CDS:1, partial [Dentiscutata heterogama]